jgi:hypothetical protein
MKRCSGLISTKTRGFYVVGCGVFSAVSIASNGVATGSNSGAIRASIGGFPPGQFLPMNELKLHDAPIPSGPRTRSSRVWPPLRVAIVPPRPHLSHVVLHIGIGGVEVGQRVAASLVRGRIDDGLYCSSSFTNVLEVVYTRPLSSDNTRGVFKRVMDHAEANVSGQRPSR